MAMELKTAAAILESMGLETGDVARVHLGRGEMALAEIWLPLPEDWTRPPAEWRGDTPEDPLGKTPPEKMVMVRYEGARDWEPCSVHDVSPYDPVWHDRPAW